MQNLPPPPHLHPPIVPWYKVFFFNFLMSRVAIIHKMIWMIRQQKFFEIWPIWTIYFMKYLFYRLKKYFSNQNLVTFCPTQKKDICIELVKIMSPNSHPNEIFLPCNKDLTFIYHLMCFTSNNIFSLVVLIMTLFVHNNLLMPYHACNYFCIDQSLNITSFWQICDHIVLWFFSQRGGIWDLFFILCICCWETQIILQMSIFTLRGATTSHLKVKLQGWILLSYRHPSVIVERVFKSFHFVKKHNIWANAS